MVLPHLQLVRIIDSHEIGKDEQRARVQAELSAKVCIGLSKYCQG
jgi:hypothetical protein